MFSNNASSSSCFNTYQNPESLNKKRARRDYELEEQDSNMLPSAPANSFFYNHNNRSFNTHTSLTTPPSSSDDDDDEYSHSNKRAVLQPLDSHLKQNTIRLLLQGSRELEKRGSPSPPSSIGDDDMDMDMGDDNEMSSSILDTNPLADPRQQQILKYFPVATPRQQQNNIHSNQYHRHNIDESPVRCYGCGDRFPISGTSNALEIILQLNLNFKCTKCGNLACDRCSMKSNITGNNRECMECLRERYDF